MSALKDCDVCHYWHFLDISFKYVQKIYTENYLKKKKKENMDETDIIICLKKTNKV